MLDPETAEWRTMELAYLAAFACALCYGVGSLLQDLAAKREAARGDTAPGDARSMVRTTTRLPYLLGTGLDGVGWALSLVALVHLPLFAVQAISAASIGVVVLGARFVDGSRPRLGQWAMLVALAGGLAAITASAQPERAATVGTAFDVAMWAGVVVVGAAGLLIAPRSSGNLAAGALGALSGVAFGGTAVCARALESDHGIPAIAADPLTWAVVAYGAIGLVLFAGALQHGSVTVSLSAQYATQTVGPALVGLLALGDRSRPGEAPMATLGFVLIAVAAVGLALVTPPVAPAASAQARGRPRPEPGALG